MTGELIIWLRCPRCGHQIRRPFLRMPGAFPLLEIHRYHGEHEVCRLLLRWGLSGPVVTAIPVWEAEDQALEQAWRSQ